MNRRTFWSALACLPGLSWVTAAPAPKENPKGLPVVHFEEVPKHPHHERRVDNLAELTAGMVLTVSDQEFYAGIYRSYRGTRLVWIKEEDALYHIPSRLGRFHGESVLEIKIAIHEGAPMGSSSAYMTPNENSIRRQPTTNLGFLLPDESNTIINNAVKEE